MTLQKGKAMYNIEKTTYGVPQFVITQDRNAVFPLCLDNIHSEIKEKDGLFYGINLMMDLNEKCVLLGTFNSIAEVIYEINELYNTDLEVYCVSGYVPAKD